MPVGLNHMCRAAFLAAVVTLALPSVASEKINWSVTPYDNSFDVNDIGTVRVDTESEQTHADRPLWALIFLREPLMWQ